MRKAKHYTLRRRKNARRWELIIRDKNPPRGMGNWIYAGLYKEFDEALVSLKKNWGLEPSEEDLHTSAIIAENKKRLAEESSLDTDE